MQLPVMHTHTPCQLLFKAIFMLEQLVFKLVQLEVLFMFMFMFQ